MRPFTRLEKRIVGLTVGAVSLVAWYLLGLEPFLKEWRRVGSEITLLEAKLRRGVLLVRKKSEIEKVFQQVAELLHSETQDQMKTQVLAEVEKATRERALKVLEIKPLPTRRVGHFLEYPVELSLEGTMTQAVQLIYQLHGTFGILKVERLQVTAKSSQPSFLKILMTVSRLTKE